MLVHPTVKPFISPNPFKRLSAKDLSRNEIIERIAHRPGARLVEAPICRDASRGWTANRRGVCGERDHFFALQRPAQPAAVISRTPVVGGVRVSWWPVQAKQVTRVPAERFGLLAPYREKLASILDALPPSLDRDQGRRPELENGEDLPVPQRLR